jgi:hypothetical protein
MCWRGCSSCFFMLAVMQFLYTNLLCKIWSWFLATSHCYPILTWKLGWFWNVDLNVAPCWYLCGCRTEWLTQHQHSCWHSSVYFVLFQNRCCVDWPLIYLIIYIKLQIYAHHIKIYIRWQQMPSVARIWIPILTINFNYMSYVHKCLMMTSLYGWNM